MRKATFYLYIFLCTGILSSRLYANDIKQISNYRDGSYASSSHYKTVMDWYITAAESGEASAQYNLGVTVIAQNATTADALSTAISVMPLDQAVSFIKFSKTARALVTTLDGALVNLKSS